MGTQLASPCLDFDDSEMASCIVWAHGEGLAVMNRESLLSLRFDLFSFATDCPHYEETGIWSNWCRERYDCVQVVDYCEFHLLAAEIEDHEEFKTLRERAGPDASRSRRNEGADDTVASGARLDLGVTRVESRAACLALRPLTASRRIVRGESDVHRQVNLGVRLTILRADDPHETFSPIEAFSRRDS